MDPNEAVVARMRELRKKRGLTAEQLGAAMTGVGIPWNAGVVTKLETGRRKSISVVELLALAYVLDVAPVHLLVPVDDSVEYQAFPGHVPYPARHVREWVRGHVGMGDTDLRAFYSEVPAREWPPSENILRIIRESSDQEEAFDGHR